MRRYWLISLFLFVAVLAMPCSCAYASLAELAMKAVSRGGTVFAGKSLDGITVWYQKNDDMDDDSDSRIHSVHGKIVKLSDDLFAIGSGFAPDCQYILKLIAQKYNDGVESDRCFVPLRRLASVVAEYYFERSLMKNSRPWGVSLIIGGFNTEKEAEIILIDPSGNEQRCSISCFGRNSDRILKKWQTKYSPRLDHSTSKLMYNIEQSVLSENMISCMMEAVENIEDDSVTTPIHYSLEDKRKFVQNYKLNNLILTKTVANP